MKKLLLQLITNIKLNNIYKIVVEQCCTYFYPCVEELEHKF